MRVFHLRNSHLVGGPERLLLDQGRRAAPGVEGTLVSFCRRAEASPFLAAAERAGLPARRVEQAGAYDPRVVGRVRRLLREGRPDVAVGHDYKANLVLALAVRGLALPRVAVVHGYTAEDLKVALFEALDRRLLRGADAVVAVSEAAAERLRRLGVAAARLHVVPNAVDVARVAREAAAGRAPVRAELGYGGDDLVIATVGRLSPEKNQRALLEAFPAADPRARLLVVGDGPERRALEEAAWRAGLAGRARFLGWRADAARCLGAADLFVLPSLREGLPLALLEAMAASRAIVASRVGGVADALDGGGSGVLVPPGEVAALRAALTPLLRDAERRAELGARAHARAAERYDVARQVRALEGVYASVAAAARHASA